MTYRFIKNEKKFLSKVISEIERLDSSLSFAKSKLDLNNFVNVDRHIQLLI
jgi:hypothetical protein